MLKPRRLRQGDRIAVVSPASPFERDEFDKGLAELRRLGFEPVFQESVFDSSRGYLSGDEQTRAKVLLDAWRDPGIAGLIAVRGGYGSVHLLPYLAVAELRATPKVFVGYSDLTTLLTFLTIGCGIVSFHGPMLDRRLGRGEESYDRRSFERALMHSEPMGELPAGEIETFRRGEASGILMGGTLTQIVASLGTPYAFDPPVGHVLFLEDVGERPYRIDRMMTQLRLSGVLGKASAVILGEFPGCDEPQGEPIVRGVLADLLRDFNGPVIYGFPSGHTAGPLVTLPFGVKARVIADRAGRVVIEEGSVA